MFQYHHPDGRGKELRWRDDTAPLSGDDGSPSYRDILLRQPRATTPASAQTAAQVDAPAPMPTLRSIVVLPPRGEGGHRKRPHRGGRRLPSPPPWTDKRSWRRNRGAERRSWSSVSSGTTTPTRLVGLPLAVSGVKLHIALLASTLMVGNELRGGARLLGTIGSGLLGRKRRGGDASPRCSMDDA